MFRVVEYFHLTEQCRVPLSGLQQQRERKSCIQSLDLLTILFQKFTQFRSLKICSFVKGQMAYSAANPHTNVMPCALLPHLALYSHCDKWLDKSQSWRLSWCAPGNGCPAPFQTWMLSMEMLLCAWALSFELPWHACWVLQLSMVMTPEIVKTLKIKSLNERIVQGNQTGFVPCFLLCVLFSPEQSCVYWVVPVSLLAQAKS